MVEFTSLYADSDLLITLVLLFPLVRLFGSYEENEESCEIVIHAALFVFVLSLLIMELL